MSNDYTSTSGYGSGTTASSSAPSSSYTTSSSSYVAYSIDIDFRGKIVYDSNNERKMIEVGTSEPLALIYGRFPNSWGESSRIYFYYTSAKVTLYNNGTPIVFGGWLYKGEIGNLTVKANVVSAGWDDIYISVTGTPLPGYGTYTSPDLYLTAYKIEIEVKEKPWGGGWISPEDQNTYVVAGKERPWYHLWQENENAIRADVKPQCLADIVTNKGKATIFGTLGVVDFAEETDAPVPNAKPKWKKIDTAMKLYQEIMATITVPGVGPSGGKMNITLTGTQTPADIAINRIKSVEWVQVGDAKLKGNNIFPEIPIEKLNSDEVVIDKVDVLICLKEPIPDGMMGTVHMKILDPLNPCAPESYSTMNDNYSHLQPDDYKEWVEWEEGGVPEEMNNYEEAYTINFYGGSDRETKHLKFDRAPHAGDNFVLAVHPNRDTRDRIEIESVQEKYNEWRQGGTQGTFNIRENIKAKVESNYPPSLYLEVWRTLWIELDQMAAPTADDGFGPDHQFIPGEAGPRGDIENTDNKWMEWDDYQTFKADPNNASIEIAFDIKKQPDKPDITLLAQAMLAANIIVEEVPQGFTDTWRTETSFVYEINDWSTVEGLSNESRDITINSPEFWCVHVIGAYKGPITNLIVLGQGTRGRNGIAVIYAERIRYNVENNPKNEREYQELVQIVTFHEVLHSFGFLDYTHPEYDDVADGPIMNYDWMYEGNRSLSNFHYFEQIQKIQTRDYPH